VNSQDKWAINQSIHHFDSFETSRNMSSSHKPHPIITWVEINKIITI